MVWVLLRAHGLRVFRSPKGAGSVINGYESMTGQINAELKKPLTSERIFLNLFRSFEARNELNFHAKSTISSKLSTNVFIHYNERSEKFDKNNDGFFRHHPKLNNLLILLIL